MANNLNESFFEEQTPSSLIKAKIVSEYFPKYCNIILKKPQHKIGYIDLFAGPGMYKDGKYSTPLLVAQNCIKDERLLAHVWLIFNDNYHCQSLVSNFEKEIEISRFKNKPFFRDKTVGEDPNIDAFLKRKYRDSIGNNSLPSVLFIDPFGPKGINTLVLADFLDSWGNELFIFLNTKKINYYMSIQKFDALMNDLFPSNIDVIREDKKYKLSVTERLNLIIDNLANEYRKILGGTIYSTAFRFQEEDSEATSHFILHLTKNSRGFDLIKQIYDEFDNVGATLDSNGAYTFDAKRLDKEHISMFDFGDMNIETLCSMLKDKFKGRTLSALQIFESSHSSNNYARRHYREALRKLAESGDIIPTFTDNRNHVKSVLLSNDCLIQFK